MIHNHNKLTLQAIIPLEHHIRLILPPAGTLVTEHIESSINLFKRSFGGVTAYKAKVSSQSLNKGPIITDHIVIECYAVEDTLDGGLDDLIDHARQIKIDLDLDSVAIGVDGLTYIF